jgi:hypothetical protein
MFRKAVKRDAKLRLALSGSNGSAWKYGFARREAESLPGEGSYGD